MLLKVGHAVDVFTALFRRFLQVNEQPFLSVGVIGILLVTIFYVIILAATWLRGWP